jgi:hypothetical protein
MRTVTTASLEEISQLEYETLRPCAAAKGASPDPIANAMSPRTTTSRIGFRWKPWIRSGQGHGEGIIRSTVARRFPGVERLQASIWGKLDATLKVDSGSQLGGLDHEFGFEGE